MFEYLDIRTLAFTTPLFCFLFGGGLAIYGVKHPSFKGISEIGFGYLALGFGFTLLGLRDLIADFLSVVVANLLILIALMLTHEGTCRFRQVVTPFCHKAIRYMDALVLSIFLLLFSFFTYFEPNINLRIMVVCVFFAAYSLLICHSLLTPSPFKFQFINKALAIIYVAFAILNGLRFMVTFYQEPLLNFMDASHVHGLSLLAFQIIVLCHSFSMVWMASTILEEQLIHQAQIDPLTKVYNRRALDEMAQVECSRARRNRHAIAVVLCDIDYFKRFNDTYGHQVGDLVLFEFASLLKHNTRDHDIVARYGGEEFLILLPETSRQQACQLAEKLRVKTTERLMPVSTTASISITASFGVSGDTSGELDWEKLVSLADQALYQAKDQGRNTVVCHEIGSSLEAISNPASGQSVDRL